MDERYRKAKEKYGDGSFTPGTGGVALPVSAHWLVWFSGYAQSREEEEIPIVHFGGWKIDKDKAPGELEIPPGFEPYQITPQGNNPTPYDAYGSRSIQCIPIRARTGWFRPKSSTYQCLVYLFEKDPKKTEFKPHGYGLLHAKGMKGFELQKTLKTWPSILQLSINAFLPDISPWWFVMPLGSYGNKRVEIRVGRGDNTSKIAVARTIPAGTEITKDYLEAHLISPEMVDVIEQSKQMTKEWAADWNERNWKEYRDRRDASDRNQQFQSDRSELSKEDLRSKAESRDDRFPDDPYGDQEEIPF